MKKRSVFTAVVLAAMGSACSASTVKQGVDDDPVDDRDSGGEETNATGATELDGSLPRDPCTPTDKLDLLFVIDDSQSMKEEQAALATYLPSLLGMFAEGKITSPSGDTVRDLRAGRSVHFGVVTSDMGINGAPDLGACKGFGKDGLLQGAAGCASSDAGYLNYEAGMDGGALQADAACLLNVGTSGCGFEQQLEAGWKALAPSSNTSFSRGTRGHGDVENKGFLRDNSVLAVVYVSDEEDCSIPDAARELFVATPGERTLNVKCARNEGLLHSGSRYSNGLLSLRPDNPDQVVFAAIVGLPPEAEALASPSGTPDYDAMLALPAMQYEETDDPTIGRLLVEACSSPNGKAYPGRRFVEVAKEFEGNATVSSICGDLSEALNKIANKIADRLQPTCGEQ